jgi:hypothetical protein
VVAVQKVGAGTLCEPQVNLVHQRSRPQRLAGPKASEMPARQNPKLVVNETEELVDGSLFTLAPAREGAIDVIVGAAHVTVSAPILPSLDQRDVIRPAADLGVLERYLRAEPRAARRRFA